MPKTRKASAKRRARVLPVLAMLFAVGAALRLTTGLSAAFAQGPDASNAQQDHSVAPVAATAPASGTPANGLATPAPGQATQVASAATAEIALELRRRELALQEQEAAMREREVLVAAAQERLQAQIAALQGAERELASTMALADRAAEDDIARLVSVFEAMGSEEAAAVFSEMAPEFAAGFLARLEPATAAAILSGLEPRQAYGLSAILAGRNALIPRE